MLCVSFRLPFRPVRRFHVELQTPERLWWLVEPGSCLSAGSAVSGGFPPYHCVRVWTGTLHSRYSLFSQTYHRQTMHGLSYNWLLRLFFFCCCLVSSRRYIHTLHGGVRLDRAPPQALVGPLEQHSRRLGAERAQDVHGVRHPPLRQVSQPLLVIFRRINSLVHEWYNIFGVAKCCSRHRVLPARDSAPSHYWFQGIMFDQISPPPAGFYVFLAWRSKDRTCRARPGVLGGQSHNGGVRCIFSISAARSADGASAGRYDR